MCGFSGKERKLCKLRMLEGFDLELWRLFELGRLVGEKEKCFVCAENFE
jgi:hypothetical protein